MTDEQEYKETMELCGVAALYFCIRFSLYNVTIRELANQLYADLQGWGINND